MKNTLVLAKRMLLSGRRKAGLPYKMTFAATYRCNLRCEICGIWRRPHGEEMAVGEIRKMMSGMRGLSWIDLTGGEISVREDVADIAGVIMDSAPGLAVFHVSTNGQMPERIFLLAGEIIKRGLAPVINVSVDGPPRVNDLLRGVEGSYYRSLETFRMLKALKKGHYYLSCTISKYNIDYLEELITVLGKEPCFSPSDLHFNLFHASSHYYGNDQVEGNPGCDPDMIERFMSLAKKGNMIKRFLEDKYITGLRRYLNGDRFPVACQAFNGSLFINPYGDIYPCGMYDRCIGNIRNYGYDMSLLWDSSLAGRVRDDIRGRMCPGCWSPCEAYPSIIANAGRVRA
ncbi:MAG: radical SAM/SPASM domain-containing protein [Candidatus Omnitrophota bacterium]